ncbi:hypothetical protein FB381_2213 [Nocardioides albertanoniae]|uniref:Uncharacterized protein n=1 Tax=Nocardioides albertanoniae TaxID=1175486 RepID=A0A543A6V4_9ACTN|nr:hypothetical protein [Nocardioides albertanoniae]TQL68324.1 hypothetical protein FB381_2213 [Nocardioides albertanoniae]
MTAKTPYAPVLRTQADVEAAWRHLINPLGWPEPRLWFMFIGRDGVPFPQLGQIEEMPAEIDAEGSENVATMMGQLVGDMGFDRVAFLLCRPGGGSPGASDRRNAAELYAACRAAPVPVEVIHLATDKDFWPMPMDMVSTEVA